MATDYQVQFVNNIESSMRALAVQGRTPPTISAIMEDAGYDAGGLHAIVTRLKEDGDKELLTRLRSAFEYAVKVPKCLKDVKPSSEPFKLSRAEDRGLPPFEDHEANFELQRQKIREVTDEIGQNIRKHAGTAIHIPPSDDEAQVLAQVISMLRPLKHVGRTRILGATSMFYGVGE